MPGELTGFRTIFSAFHHFRPGEAQGLLADAVRQREGIAVFEGTENSVAELRELTAAVGANDYHWDVGVVKSPAGPIPVASGSARGGHQGNRAGHLQA